MKYLVTLFAGALFGLGLALSGMTDTAKVTGFLDIAGAWDPDLAWVMGSALLVTMIGTPIVLKQPAPWLWTRFELPERRDIDTKLVLGSALFGAGWGLWGYCPGPALTASIYGQASTLVFLASMVVGMAGATAFARPKSA